MDETNKLAWLWVIEYVASLKELHPSFLHGLIDEAPELHEEDLGEGAREMVALRCLEHLVDGGETNLSSSPAKPKPKFTFDNSRSCDDVLLSILKETSNSDYDPLEWDMKAFIAHKRTTMPKSSLELLKDELLEGVHPCTASLMKHSGLLDIYEDNDRTSTDYFQQNDRDGNTGTKNSLNMAREGSTMLPMKKNGKVVDNENQADCPKDQGDIGDGDLHLNVKRFKCGVSSANEAAEHTLTLSPQFDNEFVEEPFKRMIETREKESLDAERESRVQGLEECAPSENGGEKVVATNGTVRSANADAICEDEHKQNLCLKCSKDGQFLVCKGVGCPMVVHEKCLGCSPRFDKNGNFYCPFCAYYYAISKYMEAKSRAASAEEELALFVNKDRRGSLGKKQREEEEPGITHGMSPSAKFNTPSRS